MNARAAAAAVLSLILALAPGAQAQVVSGRAASVPRVISGLPAAGAPALTFPVLAPTLALAPGLAAPLASPPAFAVPSVRAAAAVPALRPTAALAARPSPAASAAPAPGEPGPAPARVLAERGAELRAAFDEKKPEDAPSAAEGQGAGPLAPGVDAPARAPASAEPPRPPENRGPRGFSRPLVWFLVALVIAQVGIEAQTAGLPPLIAKVFGDVSVAADMGIAAYLADAVGTVLAPVVSRTLGLKRGYVWSTALRVATSGLIAGLLATNMIGLAGFTALLALDNVLYGVSYTLEKSIPAVMVNQDQAKLEKFKAWRQTLIEGVATVVPIATGFAVASLGFLPALLAFPVAMAAAMTVVALTLRLPERLAGANAAPLPGPRKGEVKEYWKHLGKGVAVVVKSPVLLFSLLAYSIVYAPTPIIYWFVAPAVGLHIAGEAARATAYAGMITGLYSLGSIVGALLMVRQQRAAPDAARMRRSLLVWTTATALSLAAFGLLALPYAWGVVTVPALALMLFGIPQIVAKLKLESFFQSRAPNGAVDDATAVLECAASLTIIAGLWWFGKLLAGAHVASALWLTAAAAPLALGLLALVWALARASRSAPAVLEAVRPASRLKRAWSNPAVKVAASVLAAAAFNAGVYFWMGAQAAQEFLSTYLIEWTLSLDNLVVLSTVLHALPEHLRSRVLGWGIVGAILMRIGMVTAGMGIAAANPLIFVAFGAFLLVVAAKMFHPKLDAIGWAVGRIKAAFAPKEPRVSKERKGFLANPFVWGVLAVIGYDIIFALDSVPVALAISKSVFIIVAANVFSVLGLRSLYAVLDKLEARFPHLHKGVGVVLVFVALKMIAAPLLHFHVGSLASLLVVLSVLGASMLLPSKKKP